MAPLAGVGIVVLSLGVSGTSEAQAWIRDSGDGYLELSYRTFESEELLDAEGNVLARQEYRQHALAHYGELGILDRWLMLVIQAELFQHNSLPGLGSTSGVGDARVALWSGALVQPFRLSVGVQVGLPFGDPEPYPGPDADSVEVATARSLPTGDGEFDLTAMLALGHSFRLGNSPLQMYVQAVGGYAYRTRGFADQIVYRGEVGLRIASRVLENFLLLARVSGAERLGDVTEEAADRSGNALSFTTLGPELIAELGAGIALGFGVEFGLRGTNLRLGTLFKVSLSYRFDT
ncbi:MAG: hypothetical protein AAGF12_16980 [Myxococcota bacterium]